MKSVTKAKVSKEQIEAMADRQFGLTVKNYRELNDGYYNISFLVVLEDGREVVLKIAPPADVDILTYEMDIMKSEVLFYELTYQHTDMPVPHIYGYDDSCELIPQPYYFMTKLEGVPLNHIDPITEAMRKDIYINLAQNLAKLHQIKGERYGYRTMSEACEGKDCLGALLVSVEAVYTDGVKKDTGLPIPIEDIRHLLGQTQLAFDEIKMPCLVHYDLWDGNVFVTKEPFEVSGYIDFERGFYGDPAADFCQAMGYINLSESQWFFDAYNQYAIEPIQYNNKLLVRMLSYRLYLFMIMHVECFYRDVEGSFEPQKAWVGKEIHKIFDDLKEAVTIM